MIYRFQIYKSLSILAVALLTGACSDSNNSSPTAPNQPSMVLQSASVSIDGQDVTNSTWNHGGHDATSTRFEATLMRDGFPAVGDMVHVQFDHPQGMNGMHHNSGRFQLYDDGTHGDHVPGDGIYCLEDFGMGYGFHHGDSPHGEYHYEYFGQDHDGYESNHMRVTVNVDD